MAKEEAVEIAGLHLLDEAKNWWFGHLEHAKVTKYSYFFHKLRNRFDVQGSLLSPPAAKVLVSREEALSSLQGGLDLLTYGVPCMDQEMHEEEEEETGAGTLEEKRPSLLLAVGDTIVPVGGTLVLYQEVPTYPLIQGMHTHSSPIVSVDLIETYGVMPSGPMHNQGLEQNVDLNQQIITA